MCFFSREKLLLTALFLTAIISCVIKQPFGMINVRNVLNSFERAEGGYALPAEVQMMKLFVEKSNASSFYLVSGFSDFLTQRTVEYLYPAKMDQGSPLVFAPKGVSLPQCTLITKAQVNVYICN